MQIFGLIQKDSVSMTVTFLKPWLQDTLLRR